MKRAGCLVIALVLFGALGYAEAEQARAGFVKNVSGSAIIERGQESLVAKAGDKLYEGDLLATGRDGAMGVIFQDNGVLSIGPNTRLTLTKFVFEPDSQKLSFTARIKKGTLTYMSGLIGKLNRKGVSIETPNAVCGLRGTRLAIKVEDTGEK